MSKINLEQIRAEVLRTHNESLESMDLENPTQEETQFQQELTGEIEQRRKKVSSEYAIINELLKATAFAVTPEGKRRWLKMLGYQGLNVKGKPEPQPIDKVPARYVMRAYITEFLALTSRKREIEKKYFKVSK